MTEREVVLNYLFEKFSIEWASGHNNRAEGTAQFISVINNLSDYEYEAIYSGC